MAWRSRLTASLNELRVVYCANSASSAGTREFVKNQYKELKALNPTLPIYIRPCYGAQPHVAARYDRGVYSVRNTADMSAEGVLGAVEALESQAAAINARYGKGGLGIGGAMAQQ